MAGKSRQTLETGEKAPPFRLGSTDGKERSLEQGLVAGPVLATFFKVSCPTCQFIFPYIERMYQQLLAAGARAPQFWGIVQDEAHHGVSFAREFGVTFPILADSESYETSMAYGLNYVPTLFLIGSGGRIEMTFDGFSKSDLSALHKRLAEHFAVNLPALFRPEDQVPEFKPG